MSGAPLDFAEPPGDLSRLKAWLNDLLATGEITDADARRVYAMFPELRWA